MRGGRVRIQIIVLICAHKRTLRTDGERRREGERQRVQLQVLVHVDQLDGLALRRGEAGALDEQLL